jgi:hypothetical protein
VTSRLRDARCLAVSAPTRNGWGRHGAWPARGSSDVQHCCHRSLGNRKRACAGRGPRPRTGLMRGRRFVWFESPTSQLLATRDAGGGQRADREPSTRGARRVDGGDRVRLTDASPETGSFPARPGCTPTGSSCSASRPSSSSNWSPCAGFSAAVNRSSFSRAARRALSSVSRPLGVRHGAWARRSSGLRRRSTRPLRGPMGGGGQCANRAGPSRCHVTAPRRSVFPSEPEAPSPLSHLKQIPVGVLEPRGVTPRELEDLRRIELHPARLQSLERHLTVLHLNRVHR